MNEQEDGKSYGNGKKAAGNGKAFERLKVAGILIDKIPHSRQGSIVNCGRAVYEYCKQVGLHDRRREVLSVLYMNTKNRLVFREITAIGGVESSSADVREIVRTAILVDASSVVLVHNHPSGDPDPSWQDRTLTKQLAMALMLVEVKLLDHVILGDERYHSLADDGLMSEIAQEVSRKITDEILPRAKSGVEWVVSRDGKELARFDVEYKAWKFIHDNTIHSVG